MHTLSYSYLDFIPGRTSTILSELDSTLINTSPAPASFFFKNVLMRFSKYEPNFELGNPEKQIL